ncbi:hypothetical protein MYX78_10460 [Acidobacteria bacterium AH-259-G07]|nr:hypothetical protein [Acidobacteria bacterium AH-259-G07]
MTGARASTVRDRRTFLQHSLVGLMGLPLLARTSEDALPPVRAITRGPRFHWFGYYDKWEFDPADRYVLGMEVGFESRSPRASDAVRIGMVDLWEDDLWIELGESRAWCWQQGCMLQWLPGSSTEIIWNDRQGRHFVCRILDVKTGEKQTISSPIYAVSPDGRWALSTDFRRLADLRPGYGYAGIADPNRDTAAPEDSGIWYLDLQTGQRELILSTANIVKIPYPYEDWASAKHWFNHLLISPDGSRFAFLHRWSSGRGRRTRMFTANPDGTGLYPINRDEQGYTSHFIWRDPTHILAYTWHGSHGRRFYLFQDRSEKFEVVGPEVMTLDGHCSYLPNRNWIVNDTYPDKERYQHCYLYHVPSRKRYPLGHFYAPLDYKGEWRCDTHPRVSRDGTKVVLDSSHGGNGRQLYLIDISEIALNS